MAEQAEQAFVKTFVNTLSSQPVTYADNYQQPPHNLLKKVPILPIDVPAPPERQQYSSTQPTSISVTFKSSKPPQAFTLSVEPTDTITDIKSLIASQPRAPPANAQRLLLKGKALADGKLLKEYNVKDGDTVNLMVKPGWEQEASQSPPSPRIETSAEKLSTQPKPKPGKVEVTGSRHQRIPSVVLSPSPGSTSPLNENPPDINLTLDTSSIPTASLSPTATQSTYHSAIAQPAFWQRLRTFLSAEFYNEHDALLAFEDYLGASKGILTANEVAKIRDEVGVVGMAGT